MEVSIERRVERWLSEVEGVPVSVEAFSPVSAGARRVNALFDAVRPSGTERLAFTMNQTEEIEIIGVAVEAGVRTLAEQAGVRTPKVHHVCTDPSVAGGPFFISTAIDGVSIPRQVMRKAASLELGERIVDQLGTAMALLHSVEVDRAPEALPRPETGGPIVAALDLLREAIDTMVCPSPTFSMALRRLEEEAPDEPASLVVVHRDIRVGNIIVDDDGLAALLDWETCHLGDAMEDLAWPCLRMWRFGENEHRVGGLAGIDVLRAAYEHQGGRWDEARFEWWRLLSTVRWGVSLTGQARAHLDGRHRSIVMAASGRRRSELEYDTLMLLRPGR